MRDRVPWLVVALVTILLLKMVVLVVLTLMNNVGYAYEHRRGEFGHPLDCRVVYDGYTYERRGDCGH